MEITHKVEPKKFFWYCKYDACCDGYFTKKEFIEEFGKNALAEFKKNDSWVNVNGIEYFTRYWKKKTK